MPSNYRKEFVLDTEVEYGERFSIDNLIVYSISLSPRYRFTDKFTMKYGMKWNRKIRDMGYVAEEDIDG